MISNSNAGCGSPPDAIVKIDQLYREGEAVTQGIRTFRPSISTKSTNDTATLCSDDDSQISASKPAMSRMQKIRLELKAAQEKHLKVSEETREITANNNEKLVHANEKLDDANDKLDVIGKELREIRQLGDAKRLIQMQAKYEKERAKNAAMATRIHELERNQKVKAQNEAPTLSNSRTGGQPGKRSRRDYEDSHYHRLSDRAQEEAREYMRSRSSRMLT